MCRVLMYAGEPVCLDDLLYRPNSSLIRQTYQPQMLEMLSLAGFGMLAWDRASARPDVPFVYRSIDVPLFDTNLKSLAGKLDVATLLAHVRGVDFEQKPVVGIENVHPFHYPGYRIALAHNGFLASFERMRFSLLEHVKPEIAQLIRGNTDSEWIYAVLLSQLPDAKARCTPDEIVAAAERCLSILRDVRRRHDIAISSPVNLFITDGVSLVAVRFTFDFGCYDYGDIEGIRARNHAYLGAWYTTGHAYGFKDGEWKMLEATGDTGGSVLVSSEPLTRDTSTWLEVPEYSAFIASNLEGDRQRRVHFLDV